MRSSKLLVILVGIATATALSAWLIGRDAGDHGTAAHRMTEKILTVGPRPPGSDSLARVREIVCSELESVGWVTQRQKFERGTPIGPIQFENVRARFKTAEVVDPWQRAVTGILAGHIDSKYYQDMYFVGADDAASACAALVVIGRHLAQNDPKRAAQMELVFFDGEEAIRENITPSDGLYGSRYYANQWRPRPDKPKFGIVLDMIGHRDLAIRLPSDTPKHLREAVFAAASDEDSSRYFGMAPGPIIDDHVPLNFAGIPTVDIIGDFSRKSWWHTPADNLSIISPESLDISIRVTLRALERLLPD